MSERYYSPALRSFPTEKLHVAPLVSIEAQIYNRLWRLIREGKLRPGAKLREEVIGDVFGVSRTITRKVLQTMGQEGGVCLLLNRGAYVATPTPDDAVMVFETLEMIMVHVIGKLSDPSTTIQSSQRNLIEQHIEAQSVADASNDLVASQILDMDFLVLLAAIRGNLVITELTDRMVMRQALVRMLYSQYALPLQHVQYQRRTIDAILNHRGDDAIALFRDHRREFERSLRLDETREAADLAEILGRREASRR
jgi:DNA-binding GntR family transcriptional regulator